jgi:hypothetical protein
VSGRGGSASPSSAAALRAELLAGLSRAPSGQVVLGAPEVTLAVLRAVAHRPDAERVGLGAFDAIALLTRAGAHRAAAELGALVRQVVRDRRLEVPRARYARALGQPSASWVASSPSSGVAPDAVVLRLVVPKVRA